MIIGINVSDYHNIEEYIYKAHKLNCHALQIFLGNKTLTTLSEKWKPLPSKIKYIKELLKKYKIELYVHAILTLNFCNDPDSLRNQWGLQNLLYDMNLLYKLGGKACVIHMGHYITKKIVLTKEKCYNHFIESLKYVLDNSKKVMIFLETPSHKKNIIGSSLEELSILYKMIPDTYQKRIKFCVDTCHIYVTGYDISSLEGMKLYFEQFNKLIGLKNLKLIHLNDSQGSLNSQIDKHASLGEGFIFNQEKIINPLKELLIITNKWKIPLILETPQDNFEKNISLLNDIQNIKYISQKGGNKKEKIISIFQDLKDYYETIIPRNKSTSFRIDSYQKIIKQLENYKKPIKTINNVKKIPNIGKKSLEKIKIILETNHLQQHNEIQIYLEKIKISKELQKIFGIGPEYANKLITEYNVTSIEDLKEKVIQKKIILTKQQSLGLQYFSNLKQKISHNEIKYITSIIQSWLPKKYSLYNAGSYIMNKKYSNDIDLIITYSDSSNNQNNVNNYIYNLLYKNNFIHETLIKGKEKSSYIVKLPATYIKYKPHIYHQMDLAIIEESYLYFYLLYFGSSKNFSKYIRKIALNKGYKLNEKGLYDKNTGIRLLLNPKSEKEIFDYLEIPYVEHKNRM